MLLFLDLDISFSKSHPFAIPLTFPRSSFVELASDSQGFNGTSLLVVIGILVGVFLIAGVAIFLLMRFAGPKQENPANISGEFPPDMVPERRPLLTKPVNSSD